MHVITGLLISYLFNKNKGQKLPPLLQIYWPIQTKHLLPGRVRFAIPLLKGDEKNLKHAQTQIKKIDGVSKVGISPVTATILIQFDESKVQADLLCAALIRLLGLEKELENLPQSTISKELKNFSKSINHALFSKTKGFVDAKTIIPLSLGLIGVVRMFTQKSVTMPAALTMVWWAYNSLMQTAKKSD